MGELDLISRGSQEENALRLHFSDADWEKKEERKNKCHFSSVLTHTHSRPFIWSTCLVRCYDDDDDDQAKGIEIGQMSAGRFHHSTEKYVLPWNYQLVRIISVCFRCSGMRRWRNPASVSDMQRWPTECESNKEIGGKESDIEKVSFFLINVTMQRETERERRRRGEDNIFFFFSRASRWLTCATESRYVYSTIDRSISVRVRRTNTRPNEKITHLIGSTAREEKRRRRRRKKLLLNHHQWMNTKCLSSRLPLSFHSSFLSSILQPSASISKFHSK